MIAGQPSGAGSRMKISGRGGEISAAKLFSRAHFKGESHDCQSDVVFEASPPLNFFDLCGWRVCNVVLLLKEPKSDIPVAPPSTAARGLVHSDCIICGG